LRPCEKHAGELLFFREAFNVLVLRKFLLPELPGREGEDDQGGAVRCMEVAEQLVLALRESSFARHIHAVDHFAFEIRKFHGIAVSVGFRDAVERARTHRQNTAQHEFDVQHRVLREAGLSLGTHQKLALKVPIDVKIGEIVEQISVRCTLGLARSRQHLRPCEKHAGELLFFREAFNVLVLRKFLLPELPGREGEDDQGGAVRCMEVAEQLVLALRESSFARHIHAVDHFAFEIRKFHGIAVSVGFRDAVERARTHFVIGACLHRTSEI